MGCEPRIDENGPHAGHAIRMVGDVGHGSHPATLRQPNRHEHAAQDVAIPVCPLAEGRNAVDVLSDLRVVEGSQVGGPTPSPCVLHDHQTTEHLGPDTGESAKAEAPHQHHSPIERPEHAAQEPEPLRVHDLVVPRRHTLGLDSCHLPSNVAPREVTSIEEKDQLIWLVRRQRNLPAGIAGAFHNAGHVRMEMPALFERTRGI